MMKRLRRWFDLMRVDLSDLTVPSAVRCEGVRKASIIDVFEADLDFWKYLAEAWRKVADELRADAVRAERAEACIINILEAERDAARADLVALREDRQVAGQELRQAAKFARALWTGTTSLPDLDDQQTSYSFDVWLERLADRHHGGGDCGRSDGGCDRVVEVPAAPGVSVSAERVRRIKYEHFGEDLAYLGPCVLVQDLTALGVTVTDE